MNSQIAQATQAQNLFETTIFTDLKDAWKMTLERRLSRMQEITEDRYSWKNRFKFDSPKIQSSIQSKLRDSGKRIKSEVYMAENLLSHVTFTKFDLILLSEWRLFDEIE
jgi:hypothetical protein